jgi:mannose-6-phosphate isomerase-like protein (cupin superfamily)
MVAQNVFHTDELLLEGAGSAFDSICRWKTVLGATKSGLKLTVGIAYIFPRRKDEPEEPPNCHAHSHDELYYLIEGSGITRIDGKDTQTTAGSAIFLPGGCTHGFKNTGSVTAKLLYVFACDQFADVEYEFDQNDLPQTSKPLICNELNMPQQWDRAFPSCRWKVLIGEGENDGANRKSKMTLLRTEILPQQPSDKTTLHTHSQPEIYYIVKGSGIVYIAGQLYPVHPGSIVLIPKWTAHAICNVSTAPLELVDIFGARNLGDVNFHFSTEESAADSQGRIFGHEVVPSPMQTRVQFQHEPLLLKASL